jgi:2-phosphosulfolactate phosphatase
MKELQVYLIKKKFELTEIEQDDIVIVIDILRACSTIVTALNSGIEEIIPCTNVSEVQNIKFKDNEILTAGERNGEKIPYFDFDNSPISFLNKTFHNGKLALTTTNCTEAINIASKSLYMYFGCFLNYSTVFNFLKNIKTQQRVIFLSSGYKQEESEEDNIFAYSIISELKEVRPVLQNDFEIPTYFNSFSFPDIKNLILNTSHSKRLIKLGKKKDIEFSLNFDKFDCLPQYANGSIKKCNT